MYKNIQAGFTLIELMVTLVLGLLISAAALQIFYLSTLSSNVQQAGSNLVDNNIFGIDLFLKEVRKAGLGSQAPTNGNAFFQNHLTRQGGIVLTAPASNKDADIKGDTNLYGLLNGTSAINTALLSKANSPNSGSNIKGIANSDQLTIQYKVPEDNQVDCMGRNVRKNDYVIERYFLRNDTTYGLSLACVSAIYQLDNTKLDKTPAEPIDISKYKKPDGTDGTSNLAGNGEIIAGNVDYFRVLLGVTDAKDFATDPTKLTLQYIPIPSNPTTDLANKRIVSVQIGMLTRATNSTKTTSTTFDVLDKKGISLADTVASDGKMRNVLENTVLIRNARGTVK